MFKLVVADILILKYHMVVMATAAILNNIANFQIAKTFLSLGQLFSNLAKREIHIFPTIRID